MTSNPYVHEHKFKEVVKRKGKQARFRCEGCNRIGPWVVFYDESVIPGKADYNSQTVGTLKTKAKERGLRGYSTMTKAALVAALEEADGLDT